jgi:hypothetical protein
MGPPEISTMPLPTLAGPAALEGLLLDDEPSSADEDNDSGTLVGTEHEVSMADLAALRYQTLKLLDRIKDTESKLYHNSISMRKAHFRVSKGYREFHATAGRMLGEEKTIGIIVPMGMESVESLVDTCSPLPRTMFGDLISTDAGSGSLPSPPKPAPKRLRLTNNQTRFLMSEFARQANPDSAHQVRLAREIPGMTPKQVQGWFANR